jgi:hypothetical protein
MPSIELFGNSTVEDAPRACPAALVAFAQMPTLDEIRAHLTPAKEDEPGYLTPEKASDWAALTDDELFRLRRKIERDNMWHYATRLENELSTRLIHALSATREASDAAAKKLANLTWALIVLTVVIAGFTIALFFRG